MPASERIGKYLSVERSDYQPRGGRTVNRRVLTNRGDCLGTIAWYGLWRQYTFDPVQGSTFNRDCLLDIAAYLERINKAHREGRRVELRCNRSCGKGRWVKAGTIDITTSGHTDQRCACGGEMVVS